MTNKTFTTQILFGFSKKYFTHPAVFADVGYGSGSEAKMVCQKFVVFAALGTAIASAQQSYDFSAMADLNDMIRCSPLLKNTLLCAIEARTEDELFVATDTALGITSSDTQGWFESCNYTVFKN